MAPATTSASPAVTMTLVEMLAAESLAASAKGTVSPSAIPSTTSRIDWTLTTWPLVRGRERLENDAERVQIGRRTTSERALQFRKAQLP